MFVCYHLISETTRFHYPDELRMNGTERERSELQRFFTSLIHYKEHIVIVNKRTLLLHFSHEFELKLNLFSISLSLGGKYLVVQLLLLFHVKVSARLSVIFFFRRFKYWTTTT